MASRPPKHDASALAVALGNGRALASLTREGRVALLGEAFQALLAGRLPSQEAASFLGAAGMSWLTNGGNFERDYLKVIKAQSHRTPAAIWQSQQSTQVHPDEGEEMEAAE